LLELWQEIFLWVQKGFLWVWLMGDQISERTTHFFWDHFAGKMSVDDILYSIIWAPADERRAMINNPAGKNSGDRPAP
jgi:hypothetical protein